MKFHNFLGKNFFLEVDTLTQVPPSQASSPFQLLSTLSHCTLLTFSACSCKNQHLLLCQCLLPSAWFPSINKNVTVVQQELYNLFFKILLSSPIAQPLAKCIISLQTWNCHLLQCLEIICAINSKVVCFNALWFARNELKFHE